jgi:AraC family transcriptional regulator of adaptative response/methylated-DNA-[protein]-cysteine methyltransferase
MRRLAEVGQRDALPTEQDPRWKSVVARDAAADGNFYYSVATTGVYCLPSCAARLPRPGNVRFHQTRADAEQAGFRPCKRCKPERVTAGPRWIPDEIHYDIGIFSLGLLLVARSSRGLCAVLLGDDGERLRRDLAARFPGATLLSGGAGMTALTARVRAFIESPARGLDEPLDLRGSEFQQRVWQALRQIPAGATTTYADVARRLGRPGSARAVAGACAANLLAVVVPCHRVVRSDGSLSGYRWGVERKRALLAQEALP